MEFTGQPIDRSIPVPLYYQLKTILLQTIKNGDMPQGEAIPTELELNKIFGISRTTIRQAILELVNEGYLYRVKGKGTFISSPKIVQDFMRKLESYNSQIIKAGKTPKTKVLSMQVILPDEQIKEILKLDSGSDVIKIDRLRFADDEPIVIVETFLPLICDNITINEMQETGLYAALSKNENTKIVRVTREVEAIISDKTTSDYLNVLPGSAIQLTKTIGFNKENVPIEYSVAKYRGDRNKFIIELHLD